MFHGLSGVWFFTVFDVRFWVFTVFDVRFLADPPSGGISSRFTHVCGCFCVSVFLCVCHQLTKLFNIFGSG